MKAKFTAIAAALLCTYAAQAQTDFKPLFDDNLETAFTGTSGVNNIPLTPPAPGAPLQSYRIFSGGGDPSSDPVKWTLKGSRNEKHWKEIDSRENQKFPSRYQEILCVVPDPEDYEYYMLEIEAADGKQLSVSEIKTSQYNLWAGWEDFFYPEVNFVSANPETKGAQIYATLVQDPADYIKYHCQQVCSILYNNESDPMPRVEKINYTLKEFDGISSKSGQPPVVSVVYSTVWVERSAAKSLYELDRETRGVLYHELTHAYQHQPQGIGNYNTNKEFRACVEGIADAVRAQAGLFDMSTRKPGGNWLDGYRTTGFFIQWLTTKDPDAIRNFHQTVYDLGIWSFDKAIKSMFGWEASIDDMWNEYQTYLKAQAPASKPALKPVPANR